MKFKIVHTFYDISDSFHIQVCKKLFQSSSFQSCPNTFEFTLDTILRHI